MKKYVVISLIASSIGIIALGLFYPPQKEAGVTGQLSRIEKDAIIERALALELTPTNTTVSDEANAVSKEAMKKVHECDYEKSIDITVSGLKKFPQDFTLQSDLAALLGDTSEITPEPLKSRMLEKSKAMFDRLLVEAEGQPKQAYYPFKNEYFYRLGMYKEQYELGVKGVADYWATNDWNAYGVKEYYYQGVGATYYAKQLLMRGDKEQALAWAQKALAAWAQYFSYENDYYNSYVHYALALGILGYKEEMMRALQRSAALIKKDLNYHEFQEVQTFINGISKT
jgi:tetratricopeptide (TPR) repeat protein